MIYIGKSGHPFNANPFIVTHDSKEQALEELKKYLRLHSTYQCQIFGSCNHPKEHWENATIEETSNDMVIPIIS